MARTAASALPTVVASRASVERAGEDRHPSGDARDIEIVAAFLHEVLVALGLGRGLEDPVRIVR